MMGAIVLDPSTPAATTTSPHASRSQISTGATGVHDAARAPIRAGSLGRGICARRYGWSACEMSAQLDPWSSVLAAVRRPRQLHAVRTATVEYHIVRIDRATLRIQLPIPIPRGTLPALQLTPASWMTLTFNLLLPATHPYAMLGSDGASPIPAPLPHPIGAVSILTERRLLASRGGVGEHRCQGRAAARLSRCPAALPRRPCHQHAGEERHHTLHPVSGRP
jgi:hypothetical protein